MRQNALVYLLGKQGQKGKEISYSTLEMAEYLQPSNSALTIEQKRDLFSIRNRMLDIPQNFPGKNIQNTCVCGETEEMIHIYNCEMLKESETNLPYEKIFNGSMKQQIEVYNIFKENLDRRETMRNKINRPCDPDEIRCISVMDI